MEQFWKWLMRTDAKALFATSLVVLVGVLAWCAMDQIRGSRKPAPLAPQSAAVERASYVPLGLLDFVNRQFAPETLIVPVNPFHPTFEEIVRSIMENSKSGEIEIIAEDGSKIKVHFEGKDLVDANGRKIESPFQRDLTPKTPNLDGQRPAGGPQRPKQSDAQKPTPPKPKSERGHGRAIRYSGMMQRPDGQFAAYVTVFREEDGGRSGHFVAVGDVIEGTKINAVGRESIEITLRNGETATLTIGAAPVVLR